MKPRAKVAAAEREHTKWTNAVFAEYCDPNGSIERADEYAAKMDAALAARKAAEIELREYERLRSAARRLTHR